MEPNRYVKIGYKDAAGEAMACFESMTLKWTIRTKTNPIKRITGEVIRWRNPEHHIKDRYYTAEFCEALEKAYSKYLIESILLVEDY